MQAAVGQWHKVGAGATQSVHARDCMAAMELKRLQCGPTYLRSDACGNITAGWRAAAVIDVLMYAGFGVLMIACLWFIDRTLKDDGD